MANYVEAALFLGRWRFNFRDATTYVVVDVMVNLILIFFALVVTSGIISHGLGALGPAMLKITAIAIFPSAIAGVVREQFGVPGFFISHAVAFIAYWLSVRNMFDMEFVEAGISTIVLWIMRTWVGGMLFLQVFRPTITDNPRYKIAPPAQSTTMPADDAGQGPSATQPAILQPIEAGGPAPAANP